MIAPRVRAAVSYELLRGMLLLGLGLTASVVLRAAEPPAEAPQVVIPPVGFKFPEAEMPIAGTAWWVAPDGDDSGPGSKEKPWATIQRAQQAAEPGDSVSIRGGTYRLKESQIARTKGIFAHLIVLNKSGKPGQPIRYQAYNEERPIFDCGEVKPEGRRVTAFCVEGDWIVLEGIEIVGVQVTIKSHTQSICVESNGNRNVFKRLLLHDGQAIGIYHVRGSDNLFVNCDAWNNWDTTSEDGKGGNVDGFGCHPTKGSKNNIFRGCRAWFNSDDGYDCLGAHEVVTFENCWAMHNGYSPKFERTGDGNGFKAGGYGSLDADRLPNPIPRHVVRGCLAVGNKNSGFYANHHPGGCDWIRNSASRNGTDFNMLGRLSDNRTDVDGYGHNLYDNLSYPARRPLARINPDECTTAGNSFTLDLRLTDGDFVNLDPTELFRPRDRLGTLPHLGFLRPAAGSKLIGAGVGPAYPKPGPAGNIGALDP